MALTATVEKILAAYEGETPGTKASLARLLMSGHLGGTGRMIILPVDQGVEHGPARSFAMNPLAYDPTYFYDLAIEAGLSAYAAPLGSLSAGADRYAGAIPLILKMNSSNSLSRLKEGADQAVTASVEDALRLGCTAIGFTIYPGSDAAFGQMEELREIAREAKAKGLAVVVWSYPRGGDLTKEGEQALDVVAYGAHLAAQLGANIIKVKLPTSHLEQPEARAIYERNDIPRTRLEDRVRHIVQACFGGKRLVVFSGGAQKSTNDLLEETRAIHKAGGNGSIMGRNCFQRPRKEALDLLASMISIYKTAP